MSFATAICGAALAAIAPAAFADSSSSSTSSPEAPAATAPGAPAPQGAQASPTTSTQSTTEAAPPAAQPGASTTQTTAPAPAAAPEAVTQHSQPSTGEAALPGRSNPSAGLRHTAMGGSGTSRRAGVSGNRSTTGGTHALALAPGALAPPLAPTLAGSMGAVPSFFINTFSIPPFLLPLYQAAGAAYGIPWQVLAAINEVETDYGRDLSLSSAGAEGWMQFLPAEWTQFGVDVNNDGFKDPYNPADAIFAAARYLEEAGGRHDIRAAVFAYNHSQAYVQSVMLRARLLGGTPPELLGAVSGLSEGRFPVYAPSHFSDGFSTTGSGRTLVGTTIYSRSDAPVIAVQDGRIARIGSSPGLGRYLSLADSYGNTYTYAGLGSLAMLYPVLEGPKRFSLHRLRIGVRVIAGTVLGHLSSSYAGEPHMLFQVKPAGVGAPLIDPKPLLDGWVKLQDSSAIRVDGAGPMRDRAPAPGQALLESKAQLEREMARERRIPIAACERRAIAGGRVDRRVLAALQFLTSSGLVPTVARASCTTKRASHARSSTRGLVSVLMALARRAGATAGQASGEDAGHVVLSAINGTPVSDGHGVSPLAVAAMRRLAGLQGTMRPVEIAAPLGAPKAANVVLRSDLLDIRISFGPSAKRRARAAAVLNPGLSPVEWVKLIARLGQIPDPTVGERPSPAAVPDSPTPSAAKGRG